MLKWFRIWILEIRIANLKNEISDFESMLQLRMHFYHSDKFQNSEKHEIFKKRTLSKIWKLKKRIIEIKNKK